MSKYTNNLQVFPWAYIWKYWLVSTDNSRKIGRIIKLLRKCLLLSYLEEKKLSYQNIDFFWQENL